MQHAQIATNPAAGRMPIKITSVVHFQSTWRINDALDIELGFNPLTPDPVLVHLAVDEVIEGFLADKYPALGAASSCAPDSAGRNHP